MSIICCCICHSSDVACYTKADSAEGGDWERGWMGRRLNPSVRWHQLSSSTRLLERPLFILYTAARLQQLGVVVIACDLLMMFSWNMTLRLLFFRTLSYLSFSFAFLMLSFHHYLPLAFSCSFLLPFRCFPFVFLSFCLPELFCISIPSALPLLSLWISFPFAFPIPFFCPSNPFTFLYLSFVFPFFLHPSYFPIAFPFFFCSFSILFWYFPLHYSYSLLSFGLWFPPVLLHFPSALRSVRIFKLERLESRSDPQWTARQELFYPERHGNQMVRVLDL